MRSSRSARRERQRRRQAAEAEAKQRDTYIFYGASALAGPLVGLLYGGAFAFTLGSVISISLAVFFFRASRARRSAMHDNPAAHVAAQSDPLTDYERSLNERADPGSGPPP